MQEAIMVVLDSSTHKFIMVKPFPSDDIYIWPHSFLNSDISSINEAENELSKFVTVTLTGYYKVTEIISDPNAGIYSAIYLLICGNTGFIQASNNNIYYFTSQEVEEEIQKGSIADPTVISSFFITQSFLKKNNLP